MMAKQSAAQDKMRPGTTGLSKGAKVTAAAGAAALAGTALFNWQRAKAAEEACAPEGKFVEVDGVRLHYVEQGAGQTILLIHGNGTLTKDWEISGLLPELARTHRVIALDRPGFGYSQRPRTTLWTAAAQAKLVAGFMEAVGLEEPVLVAGHSFGALVTAALALDFPERVSGVVLLSGYYYPSPRVDAAAMAMPAIPLIGDLLRYTVNPIATRAAWPMVSRKLFDPAPVHERWADFPRELAARPSQVRAEAADAGVMVPSAASLSKRYGELTMPVTIVAGSGDRIVATDDQSRRLAEQVRDCRLEVIDGVGHMIHYSAGGEVAAAIRGAAARVAA